MKNFTENSEILEELFIENAGLVLCNPFLPRLFSQLELTDEHRFKDNKRAERAVLLLHHMLYENSSLPEPSLVLNKLLCGLEPGIPVDRAIDVSPQEKEAISKMLNGMIAHWNKLGKNSVNGLIDSFLIRAGKLEQGKDTWCLKVEQKAYDVLLDSIPWSYSPIKYSWMKKPIYVRWR